MQWAVNPQANLQLWLGAVTLGHHYLGPVVVDILNDSCFGNMHRLGTKWQVKTPALSSRGQ